METYPKGALSADNLYAFFTTHLNRIYCAKSHLYKNLPEIRVKAHFGDLTHAIAETIDDVENQIGRMDQIFLLLHSSPDFKNCEGMTGLIEDTFTAISSEKHNPQLCDLAILFYLQQIESIETASFGMLKLAVPYMDKKEIRHLLQENFDEATEDLALFRLIAANYFKK